MTPITTFCVPIIFRAQANYLIRSSSEQEAIDKATDRFRNGEESDPLGNEWQSIERIGVITTVENQNTNDPVEGCAKCGTPRPRSQMLKDEGIGSEAGNNFYYCDQDCLDRH